MGKLLKSAVIAFLGLIPYGCLFQDSPEVSATIQAIGSGSSNRRDVWLNVYEGGEPTCLSESPSEEESLSFSSYKEATSIRFDSTVVGLDDIGVGSYTGTALSSRDMFDTSYVARIEIIAITATEIEGHFVLRDEDGVIRKGRMRFQAGKCPDYDSPSGLARPSRP
jgi:hypothetical protein